MDVISIVLQLILSLSILVVLHECGHFFPARWFKCRVEKFYLFFDPWFSLFKVKKGDTEYGIGWIPFGGYVKISGMIDESMDTEQMKGEPQPWEFRSKPAWQRLIIMVGGVVVNFILGFLIFAGMLYTWGESYFKSDDITNGIYVTDSIGYEMGLQHGDKILKIGEVPFDKFNPGALNMGIIINDARNIEVQRDGRTINLPIDAKYSKVLTKEKKNTALFAADYPQEIVKIADGSLAQQRGLEVGDKITAINNVPTKSIWAFAQEIKNLRETPQAFTVQYDRSGRTKSASFDTYPEDGLGIVNAGMDHFYKPSATTYGFLESFPAGVKKGIGFLKDQIKAFGQIANDRIDATDSLGSIVSIATMFDKGWDWQQFWRITAMLSILLGFFNILPIPALDGGYVLFLIYEIITGRKPSDKFMEYATLFGFILMMGLMIFALGLDISKFF